MAEKIYTTEELEQMQAVPSVNNFSPERFKGTEKIYTTAELEAMEKPKKKGIFNTIKNVAIGSGKEILNFATGASSLGEKGLRKALPNTAENFLLGTKGQESAAERLIPSDLRTPQGTAQKIGFIGTQIGEFIVPGSGITKAGKAIQSGLNATKAQRALGFLSRSALEGGSAAGITSLQGGDVESAGIIGSLIPAGGKVLSGLGSAARLVAKSVSSSLSGVPEAAMEQAFKNPSAVRSAIQRAVADGTDLSAQKIYDQALTALRSLKSARSESYEEGLKIIEEQLSRSPVKVSTLGLKSVATQTLKKFGLNVNRANIEIGESALQKAHVTKLNELMERVYSWSSNTPTGLNNLRKVVSGYRQGGVALSSSDKMFNKIINDMTSNLSEYVGRRVPDIGRLNKVYASQSEVIDRIVKQLKLDKGNTDPNTALRKLLNVFNPKSSVYRPIVEELGEKAGVDLMSDIAGLTLSQWTPQGIGKYLAGLATGGGITAAFAAPASLASLPAVLTASSPRIVGKIAAGFGETLPKTKNARRFIGRGVKAGIQRLSGR